MKRRSDKGAQAADGPAGADRSSLEAFIQQLHAEGVEAGRQEATRLRTAAEAEAAAIVARAEASARQLIGEAERKAQALLAEARADLALAVRDAQLELRDKLSRALSVLLEQRVQRELTDPNLLRDLVREVVTAYVRAEAEHSAFTALVRPELADGLAAQIPGMLGDALMEFDVKGTLREAGFEFHAHDSVVEVTAESVAEKLAEMVTPQLRELLRAAAGEGPALQPAGGAPEQPAWLPHGHASGTH